MPTVAWEQDNLMKSCLVLSYRPGISIKEASYNKSLEEISHQNIKQRRHCIVTNIGNIGTLLFLINLFADIYPGPLIW